MPYIKQQERKLVDNFIDALGDQIKTISSSVNTDDAHKHRPGIMNYCVTKLIKKVYGKDLKYFEHNEIIGVLECIKQEFYRKQTTPYEEIKIKENGDV